MQVLKDGPHAYDESKGGKQPPKPSIVRAGGKIRRVFDNQGPFSQGETKSSQRSIPEIV